MVCFAPHPSGVISQVTTLTAFVSKLSVGMLTLSGDMGGPINAFSACLTTVTLCLPSCGKACRTDSLIKYKKREEMINIELQQNIRILLL